MQLTSPSRSTSSCSSSEPRSPRSRSRPSARIARPPTSSSRIPPPLSRSSSRARSSRSSIASSRTVSPPSSRTRSTPCSSPWSPPRSRNASLICRSHSSFFRLGRTRLPRLDFCRNSPTRLCIARTRPRHLAALRHQGDPRSNRHESNHNTCLSARSNVTHSNTHLDATIPIHNSYLSAIPTCSQNHAHGK